jgi:hypothetical protein
VKKKLMTIIVAALLTLGTVGATVFAEPQGGPPNPSGQCPTGNTPGCSPHR